MLKEKLLRTREEVLSRIEEIKKEKTIAITDAASLASITNEEDLTTFAKEIVKLLTKKESPTIESISIRGITCYIECDGALVALVAGDNAALGTRDGVNTVIARPHLKDASKNDQ